MDILYIEQLSIETTIGVLSWERQIKQRVVIDLELAMDNRRVARSDTIEHALDYDALSRRLIAYVEASEFMLIETLAEHIAELIMQEFHTPWLSLRLSKPGAIRGAKNVGVKLVRGTLP